MKLSLFIAKRYLFSKKKQNAINIISVISVVGVAIGTSALVIILSVFNGIYLLLQRIVEVGEFTCQRTDDQIGGEAVRTLL